MEASSIIIKVTKKQSKEQKYRKVLIFVFCLIAIFQAGLRNVDKLPLGNDTPNYVYIYQSVANTSWNQLINGFTIVGGDYDQRDPGYSLFIKATQLISKDFTFFMFLTAIIFIIPFGMYVYRYVKSYAGIVLVFLLYFALFAGIANSFMRQAVALGIILLSTYFVASRDWFKFLLFIALAYLIHNSSLVVVPLFLLAGIKKPQKWLGLVILLSPFLIYFSNQLFSYVIQGTVYETYANGTFENPVNYILLVYIIAISALVFFNQISRIENNNVLIGCVIGALLISPIVFMGNTMLRISYYYVLPTIPLIPIVIDNLKVSTEINRIIYIVLIPLLLIYILK